MARIVQLLVSLRMCCCYCSQSPVAFVMENGSPIFPFLEQALSYISTELQHINPSLWARKKKKKIHTTAEKEYKFPLVVLLCYPGFPCPHALLIVTQPKSPPQLIETTISRALQFKCTSLTRRIRQNSEYVQKANTRYKRNTHRFFFLYQFSFLISRPVGLLATIDKRRGGKLLIRFSGSHSSWYKVSGSALTHTHTTPGI